MKTDFQLRVINIIRELRQGQNASQAYVAELLDLRSSGLVGNIESPRFPHKYTLSTKRRRYCLIRSVSNC